MKALRSPVAAHFHNLVYGDGEEDEREEGRGEEGEEEEEGRSFSCRPLFPSAPTQWQPVWEDGGEERKWLLSSFCFS